jgi:glycosyltransferase involved in cell wall biosynthesis
VLLVNKYAHVTGGADHHVVELCTVLRGRGHEVRLLSTWDARNVEPVDFGVTATVSHDSRTSLGLVRQASVATHGFWNQAAARATQRAIVEFRPDVLHAHKLYPQLSVSPIVEARRKGVPVVQTLHDYEFLSASGQTPTRQPIDRSDPLLRAKLLNSAMYQIRTRVHARRVHRWIAISEYVRNVHRPAGIDADVLEHFVAGSPSAPPSLDGRSGACFIGRLTPAKGVSDVLELARQLPDVDFTIAGMGELEAVVSATAQRLPNLRFAGRLDRREVDGLLAGSRVAVIPSRWPEPAGLVALEAMAMGTPVVATPSGGLAEYVSKSRGGVLAADVTNLAAEVRRVCSDETLWTTLSNAALRAARQDHAPDRYADRLVDLYRAVAYRA